MPNPAHSTKIGQQLSLDGDQLIIKQTFDGSQMLKDAAKARELSPNSFGSDHKLAGFVDLAMVNEWCKEAGVQWTDTAAVKEVIKKKMLSNEFGSLRVWEGTW